MRELKRLKRRKCDCGRTVVEGSVFCLWCRAAIKRKNIKILNKDKILFSMKS